MFCKNCGAEIKEGAKFCPKCGTKTGKGKTASPSEGLRLDLSGIQQFLESFSKQQLIFAGAAALVVILVFCITIKSVKTAGHISEKNAETLVVQENLTSENLVPSAEMITQQEQSALTEEADAYTGVFTDDYYELVTMNLAEDEVWELMFLNDTTDEDWERLAAAFQESQIFGYYNEDSKYCKLMSICYEEGFLSYDFCLERAIPVIPEILDGFDNNNSKYDAWDNPLTAAKYYDDTSVIMYKYSFPFDWKMQRGPGTHIVTDNGTEINYEILDEKIGFNYVKEAFKYIINGEALEVDFSEVELNAVTTGPVPFDVLKNSSFYYLDAPAGMSVTHMPALVAYGTWASHRTRNTFVLTATHKLPREKYFENTYYVNPSLENVDEYSLDWLKFKNDVEYTVNIFDHDVAGFLQSITN